MNINQHKHANYLECVLDKTITGGTYRWNLALRVIEKINFRLKFVSQKIPYNALIQPHFDYACTTWYLDSNKKLKDNLKVTQNKCIDFV